MCSRITPQRYGQFSTLPKVVRQARQHSADNTSSHIPVPLPLTINVNTPVQPSLRPFILPPRGDRICRLATNTQSPPFLL